MKTKYFLLSFLLVLLNINAEDEGIKKKTNSKYESVYTFFNINNISTFIFNTGEADINPNGNSGFEYPKGSNKYAVFQSGLLWGGKINDSIHVGGSTYRSGLQPGKILNSNKHWSELIAENPEAANKIFRVRPDYKTADLSSEINDKEGTEKEIRAKYEHDWYEWPAEDGAPFEDKNNNNIYEPEIDIPGEPGADQTIWFVANDLDPNQTKFLYGSLPIGLEIQITIWGYKDIEVIENSIFKRYRIINKSNSEINDMYISPWSDVDLGNASDDLAGCDTILQLGYIYNSHPSDQMYQTAPPSIGFTYLQGPIIPGEPSDTAKVDGRIIAGAKNLEMTALGHIFKCCYCGDPAQGTYTGTINMYNYMMNSWCDGELFPIPELFGGGYTKFPLSGDPVTGMGFIDGIDIPPADRRVMITSGPFIMAPSDTQEVVFAEVAAGGEGNISNTAAVSILKYYVKIIREYYENSYKIAVPQQANVNIAELNRKIVLSWGSDENSVLNIEELSNGGFKFQGYNIYQLPYQNAPLNEGIKIATYDLIDDVTFIIGKKLDEKTGILIDDLKQIGTNSGIERFIEINRDSIKSKRLNNGSEYYFAVTSYTYTSKEGIVLNSTESKPLYVTAIPQDITPGVRYGAEQGDIISAVNPSGNSEGEIEIKVIDPVRLKGESYQINFTFLDTVLVWNLYNLSTSKEVLINQNNFSGNGEYFISDGLQVKVIGNFSADDAYTFTSPGVLNSLELAKEDAKKINVFPNPYYGVNSQEKNKYERFVTFNHLPQRATIRIFNLAGQLVRTIEKDSPEQFAKWDLLNEHNIFAASGLFIVLIEMPDLGVTKTLKLAIIIEQIIPDYY